MLAAFEDRNSTIVPFRNINIVLLLANVRILCQFPHESINLEFVSPENRDQQLANFKEWLSIKSNSS